MPLPTPLGDQVLVKPDEIVKETKSGFQIALAENVQELPDTGTVVALPKKHFEGHTDPNSFLSVGDRIIFNRYGGSDIEVDKVPYKVLSIEEILAVIS